MSNDYALRYEEIEIDRRSELNLLDKVTLIEKVLEYEAQVLFDPEVLVDETQRLVDYLETRRRIIDFVEKHHPDLDEQERKKLVRQHLVFLAAVTG